MVKITNVKVYDLRESVIACRNAFRTEQVEYTDVEFEQSLQRAIQLANTPSGSGHSNFLKGIRVSFDIKYPNYFSPELQRYNFFDIVSSSSKMHKLKNMDMDACFNEYVTEQSKQQMKELLAQFNKDKSYESFMRLLSNCPQGIELFMRCSTNYLQLRTIYKQRKTHRLIEDWQEGFCQDFIQKLPYFNEFISGDYGK